MVHHLMQFVMDVNLSPFVYIKNFLYDFRLQKLKKAALFL